MSGFGVGSVTNVTNCSGTAADAALGGFFGILGAATGGGEFFDVTRGYKDELKKAQKKMRELQDKWKKRLADEKGILDQQISTATQNRITLIGATDKLITDRLAFKVKLNTILVLGSYALIAVVVIFLMTLPSAALSGYGAPAASS